MTDPEVLEEHLARIRDSLASDPAAAISSSKNLLESLFRIILDRSALSYGAREDIPQLYRHVADLLDLKADSVPEAPREVSRPNRSCEPSSPRFSRLPNYETSWESATASQGAASH
ncbi:MAG: hypothetical protein QOD93_5952 [Acetobacteraceae bacterium]|nr:hypothetical protein [Acetobacteraceae bacterium]